MSYTEIHRNLFTKLNKLPASWGQKYIFYSQKLNPQQPVYTQDWSWERETDTLVWSWLLSFPRIPCSQKSLAALNYLERMIKKQLHLAIYSSWTKSPTLSLKSFTVIQQVYSWWIPVITFPEGFWDSCKHQRTMKCCNSYYKQLLLCFILENDEDNYLPFPCVIFI